MCTGKIYFDMHRNHVARRSRVASPCLLAQALQPHLPRHKYLPCVYSPSPRVRFCFVLRGADRDNQPRSYFTEDMAALTTSAVGPYANISTTTAASFTGCAPCKHLQILDPAIGQWYGAVSNNISALRTTQLYIDQNSNTTSTSVDCNSDVLSEYPPPDPRYVNAPTYGLDNECNLLATWSVMDRYFGSTTLTSLPYYEVTA